MRGRVGEGASRSHPINTDGPGDVLQRLLAHVFEGEVEARRRILLDAGRYANPTRLGQAFEAGGDIDAITEDVAVLDDMSPTLIPMRNSMRLSAATPVLRSAIACCTSTAQRSASMTLANSARRPSPVVLTIRP